MAAEILQGRRLRLTLDRVHSGLSTKIKRKNHDKLGPGSSFPIGDAVITQNFSYGTKWLLGFIAKVTGPVSYKGMGEVRRYVDQILVRLEDKKLIELNIPDLPPVSVTPPEAATVSERSQCQGRTTVPQLEIFKMKQHQILKGLKGLKE